MELHIPDQTQKEIKQIWDIYLLTNKAVKDNKGQVIDAIDEKRRLAIIYLKVLVGDFISHKTNLIDFKTELDSYNKRNNLWGFTATKGQMFFNLLSKTAGSNTGELTDLLIDCIVQPRDLSNALEKLTRLEAYVDKVFKAAPDKRKVPNPSSCGYFLSYFWQIFDAQQWPVMYTSLLAAYEKLNLWTGPTSQRAAYELFFLTNGSIRKILSEHAQQEVSNWSAEHAFWNYSGNPHLVVKKEKLAVPLTSTSVKPEAAVTDLPARTNFELSEYLIPKVAKLIELGNDVEKTSSAKGSAFEKMVMEIFRQLDFEVQELGQGKGRNPDGIAMNRVDHTAFLIDAKAYADGYHLGLDDRAMKEYINRHCPLLKKDGFTRIGFIIVCNSFRTDLQSFINEITWTTEIKRFILLSSEALLYLLAYKTKDKLSIQDIVDALVNTGPQINSQHIIDKFADV